MFSTWKQEKAIATLVDAAQALSDRLSTAKPHIVEAHAAAARFWATSYAEEGRDLYDLADWKTPEVTRFAAALQTRIAALRKARDYDSSDGLAIWLHTAHAVTEPQVAPAVRGIWDQILTAGQNADAMAHDLMQDAGLPPDGARRVPKGFGLDGNGADS